MTTTASKTSVVALGAAVAFLAFAGVASADGHRGGGDDVRVMNSNTAVVGNMVSVNANTGRNDANGGDTGRGGAGGDARGKRAMGGDAGNSGRGGNGGGITTGDALALGTVNNDVNHNNTYVENCGCEDDYRPMMRRGGGHSSDDVTVVNRNRAMVLNGLHVDANTGGNDADGGYTGRGGNGGDAASRSWSRWYRMMFAGSVAGDGGTSGNAGNGGTIRTGAATADGYVGNTVNRNVTRVEAGDDVEDAD
jgi:hypothetical protein